MRKNFIFIIVLFYSIINLAASSPKVVYITSRSDQAKLKTYLFKPTGQGPHPAIVLLHGRKGLYSSLAHGVYNKSTLSKRHLFWAHYWSDRGYVAILVDSFSARGYPDGFPPHSHDTRPEEVNELTVRPIDAYSALHFLQKHSYVNKNAIGVMGWSNGGSTVLNSMAVDNVGLENRSPELGFKAGLALYPGCGKQALYMNLKDWQPYAPTYVFIAGDDEEVSPSICMHLMEQSHKKTDFIEWNIFNGATHNFDDPSPRHIAKGTNRESALEAAKMAEAFFKKYLGDIN